MSYSANRFARKSRRLSQWDYSSDAAYFITICTLSRDHFLGELMQDKSKREIWIPRPAGLIATRCWKEILLHYPFIDTDEFVVMPNHIHGILFLNHSKKEHEFIKTRLNLSFKAISQQEQGFNKNKFGAQVKNLQSVLGGFKSAVTKKSRIYQPDFRWQSRYHDRLIRNEDELNRIRFYIRENRKNWFFRNEHFKYGDLYL